MPRELRAVSDRARRPAFKTVLALIAIVGVVAVAAVLVVPRLTHASTAYSSICVYPRESIATLQSIDDLTGHEFTCVTAYSNNSSNWAEWEQPWFATTSIADWQWARWVRQASDRRLILTLSLVPLDAPANWRQVCAAGSYDGHARDLGQNLVAEGLSNSVIRLAPEANNPSTGTASVGDTSAQLLAWRQCWAQVAHSMRVPGSSFLFDWTVNSGYRDIPSPPITRATPSSISSGSTSTTRWLTAIMSHPDRRGGVNFLANQEVLTLSSLSPNTRESQLASGSGARWARRSPGVGGTTRTTSRAWLRSSVECTLPTRAISTKAKAGR